jgi:hypothetical protein
MIGSAARHTLLADVLTSKGTQTMEVRDVNPGQIFETLTDAGLPTGNIYKATGEGRDSGLGGCHHQIKAYKRFRQGLVWLYTGNLARLLDPATVDGF